MFKNNTKLLIATTGIILAWSFITPLFEFPDEQAHIGTVSYLSQNRSMPGGGKLDLSQEMLESQLIMGTFRDGLGNNKYTYHPEYHPEYSSSLNGPSENRFYELNNHDSRTTYVGSEAAKYPPLYYAFLTIVDKLISRGTLIDRVFAMRVLSVMLIPLIALTGYWYGKIMFGKKIYGITLASLIVLQPMFSFVSAGVNSDNLHNVLSSLILLLGLLLIKNGLSLKLALSSVIVLLLDVYTKPQAFINVLILALAFLISSILRKQYKSLIFLILSVMVIAILGWNQLSPYLGLLTLDNTHNITFAEYLRFSVGKLIGQNVVWYWGVFKWLGVVLPPIYWQVANRLVLLSVIGLAIYFYKYYRGAKTRAQLPYALFSLLSSIAYALAIFWYDYQHFKLNGYSLGIQARYFFPTLLSHLSLLLLGIVSLGWNSKIRRLLRLTLVGVFIWLQLGGIYRIATIYYDTSSLATLITQASQYKPTYLKGNWWFLWIGVYSISLITLTRISLSRGNPLKVRPHQR